MPYIAFTPLGPFLCRCAGTAARLVLAFGGDVYVAVGGGRYLCVDAR